MPLPTSPRGGLTRWGAGAIVGIALLTACPTSDTGSPDDASNEPCIPAQSIGCECDDGSPGARVCEPDGIGYGPCTCDGADTGTSSPTSGGPGGTGDGTADDGSSGSSITSGPDGTATDTSTAVPDFQTDIVPILSSACGGANSLCHARNAYFPTIDQGCRGWVSFADEPLGSSFDDLDPATNGPPEGPVGCPDLSLYDRLMELAPWECDASWAYVKAGSLDESYIYRKLTQGDVCGDFRVMPPPGEGYMITQSQTDALAAWILAGAPP